MWKELKALYDRLAGLKQKGEQAASEHADLSAQIEAERNERDALGSDADAQAMKAAETKLSDLTDKADAAAATVNATADEIESVQAAITAKEVQARAARAFRGRAAALAMSGALATTSLTAPALAGARILGEELNPELTGGYGSIAEFALDVRAVGTDHPMPERLQQLLAADPSNALSGAGDFGEGFPVPPAFRQEVWDLVMGEELDLFNMVDAEPTERSSVEHARDESTPWGATGVQARWRNEKSQMTESQTEEEASVVKLHSLYAFVLATDELLSDRPRLRNRLSTKAAEAIRWKLAESIIRGSGVGQPLGYINSPALVSVAKESGQAADTIVTKNITNMFSRLLAVSALRAIWLANTDILPQLVELMIGDKPVYLPGGNIAGAPFGTLLGRPVIFTEHAGTLGDQGDLQLIDPMGYYSPRRSATPDFAESMHLFFDRGETAFRWTFRAGGQPHLSGPVSPANGSATKSQFIVLDERA